MESSSTQTELVMAEVEAMVLKSKKELETLEVAVQTLELESSGGFRVRESEVEKKLDSRQSAERYPLLPSRVIFCFFQDGATS